MADKNAKAKAMTKSAVFVELATKTKLTRKQVADKLNRLLTLKKDGYPIGPDRLTVGAYMAQ